MSRMMKTIKKPLSVLLALCMFLSVISVGLAVFAEEIVNGENQTPTVSEGETVDEPVVDEPVVKEAPEVRAFDQAQFETDFAAAIANTELTSEAGYEPIGTNSGLVWMFGAMAQLVVDNKAFIDTTFTKRGINKTISDTTGVNFMDNFMRLYFAVHDKMKAHGISPLNYSEAIAKALDGRLDDTTYPIGSADMSVNNLNPIAILIADCSGRSSVWGPTNATFTFSSKVATFLADLEKLGAIADFDDGYVVSTAMSFGSNQTPNPNGGWYTTTKPNGTEVFCKSKTGKDIKALFDNFNAMFTNDILNKGLTGLDADAIIALMASTAIKDITNEGISDTLASKFIKTADDTYEGDAMARARAIVKEANDIYSPVLNHAKAVDAAKVKYVDKNKKIKVDEAATLAKSISVWSTEQANFTEAQNALEQAATAKEQLEAIKAYFAPQITRLLGELGTTLKSADLKTYFSNPMLNDKSGDPGDAAGKVVAPAVMAVANFLKIIILEDKACNTTALLTAKLQEKLVAVSAMTAEEFNAAFTGADGKTYNGVPDIIKAITADGDTVVKKNVIKVFPDTWKALAESEASSYLPADIKAVDLSGYTGIFLGTMGVTGASVTVAYDNVNTKTFKDDTAFMCNANEVSQTLIADQLKTMLTWTDTVTKEVIDLDLATVTLEEIMALKDKLVKAIATLDTVPTFAANYFLKGTDVNYASKAEALAKIVAADAAIGDLFIKTANDLFVKYGAASEAGFTKEEAAAYYVEYVEAMKIYNLLTAENKDRSDVKTALSTIEALLDSYGDYALDAYLTSVSRLDAYVDADGNPILNSENRTAIRGIIVDAGKLYNDLKEDRFKNDPRVIAYEALRKAFKDLVDATQTIPNWVEGNIPMTSTQNALGNKTIDILDSIINSKDILNLIGGSDSADFGQFLSKTISSVLYNENIVKTLLSALYPLVYTEVKKMVAGDLGGDPALAAILGIFCTPATLTGVVGLEVPAGKDMTKFGYASLYNALNGKATWDLVNWDNVNLDFINADGSVKKIDDKDSFMKALSVVLGGIWPIVQALIFDDAIYLFGSDPLLKSDDGYDNWIVPLYKQLGVTEFSTLAQIKEFSNKGKSPSSGTTSANGYRVTAMNMLLDPLLNRVEEIGKTPVKFVTDFIPSIAYLFEYNLIEEGLDGLLSPLSMHVGDMLPANISLSDFNLTVGGLINGLNLGFTMPFVNTALLSTIGTSRGVGSGFNPVMPDKSISIDGKNDQVLVYILRLVIDAVKASPSMLDGLLGSLPAEVKDLVNKILGADTDTIIDALLTTLCQAGPMTSEYDWGTMVQSVADIVYPKGVTEKQVYKAIANADKTLNAALSGLANISLKSVISDNLYTNNMVNTLLKALYTTVGSADLAPILNYIGANVTTSGVASQIGEFPSAAAIIAGAKDWASVDFNSLDWGVSNKDSFIHAVSIALRPFNSLLRTLLVNDELNLLNTISIKGNGYVNAILPLLTALGANEADGVLSSGAYLAAANQNGDNLIGNILTPILNLLDRLAASPIATLADIAPNFAYFIDNDGIVKAVEALLLPITNVTDQLVPALVGDSTFNVLKTVLSDLASINLNDLKNSIVPLINSLLGSTGIVLPPIDWALLAGCGTVKTRNLAEVSTNNFANTYVESNQADAMVTMLRYVGQILTYQNNPTAIRNLVGGLNVSILTDIVNNLIGTSPDAIVKMIVELFAPNSSSLVAKWNYSKISTVPTTYTPNLTEKDFVDAIAAFDKQMPDFLASFGMGSLSSLVSTNLYTNSMMSTIFKAISDFTVIKGVDGAADTDILAILKIAGIDMTPAGVANQLTEKKFAATRNALNDAGDKWSNVNFDTMKWGFSNGSESGFLSSLTAMLRPLSGVLGAILNGEDLVLLDGITVKGANGYSNAIVPLLEALGCDNVMSVKQYKKMAAQSPDHLILSITKPLFARLNTLLNAPISTLCDMLPNIAYFMDNNGLSQLVNAALLPITKLLNTIEPAYDVNLDLSAIKNLDLVSMVNGLIGDIKIGDSKLGIQLLDFDWADLAGRGTQEKYTSQRVDANGKRVTAMRIDSDQPAVFVTVLRYIVETVQDSKNLASIKTLLAGLDLGDLVEVVNTVLDMLATSDRDEIIEFILQLLFNIGGTPSEEVVDKVDPTKPADGNKVVDKDKGANLPLIIGLSVGGAALLAAGAWLIIAKKKKMA